MSAPTATPVAGHAHLPCSGSPRPRASQRPAASASTAITIHGERPSAEASVGAAPFAAVSAGRWRVARSGDSTPTLAVVAPTANPISTTHAPIAPSPTRYHVLPEQPPARIIPTPNASPPTRFATQ